jgi:uncharacterized damage-inducible protein DinB
MRETERIADLLEQTFEGRAYYGNSVLEALEGVSGEMAAQRAENFKNSIWEIVRHMTLELVYHRQLLEGTAKKWVAGETTWDESSEKTDAAWAMALDELKTANRALVETIKRLDDDILEKTAAPVSYPFYRSLNGVLHHGIFHAGQISVLKRQLAEK